MVTDFQIRDAIGTTIENALTALYLGSDPPVVPRVHRHWKIFDRQGGSSASLLALSGKYKDQVHAWMIGIESISRSRPLIKDGLLQAANNGSLRKRGTDRRDVIKKYKVWAFHNIDLPDEVDNSENRLVEEIEYVSRYISANPIFSFPIESGVQGHGELEFDNIDIYEYGDVTANVAPGSLSVVMFDHLPPS